MSHCFTTFVCMLQERFDVTKRVIRSRVIRSRKSMDMQCNGPKTNSDLQNNPQILNIELHEENFGCSGIIGSQTPAPLVAPHYDLYFYGVIILVVVIGRISDH